MFNIQVLNKISQQGLDLLAKDQYSLVEKTEDVDGILVRSTKMHDMEFPNSLKAIARAGAGVNNIPIDQCSEKGIVVFNTPGANANAVKELVIAGLLLSSRKIIDGIEWAKSLVDKEKEVPKLVEKGKSAFAGQEIQGKTVGIIGLGAIGVLVANAAHSLGMEVLGYDPFISVQAAWGLSRGVKRANTLEELLKSSDYITLHLPLMENTKNLLDQDAFSLMKKGVRVLNFARGGLVDPLALKKAIEDEIVASYITDFPEESFLQMDKVICIPHLGASTSESEENCAIMAVTELKEYLENGNIRNSVNYPECVMPRRGVPYRITINHGNVPNMVGQITTLLAQYHINIEDMLNRSKNNYAYTMLDVADAPTEELIQKIKDIKGVSRVRIL
ncbi:MAG: phosphoglycerate dehydrogenase [Epulopiscium sp.]|nr:phosphoglycerate dehydrogenase [Candidatus Epulonipiscium sp.]